MNDLVSRNISLLGDLTVWPTNGEDEDSFSISQAEVKAGILRSEIAAAYVPLSYEFAPIRQESGCHGAGMEPIDNYF